MAKIINVRRKLETVSQLIKALETYPPTMPLYTPMATSQLKPQRDERFEDARGAIDVQKNEYFDWMDD